MHIASSDRTLELAALVEVLAPRRGIFYLKGRLLKGVGQELKAAKESGLTWKVIWETLREEGYPGCYQQFCKAANRAIGRNPECAPNARKVLPRPEGEKAAMALPGSDVAMSSASLVDDGKPEWQIQREAMMARLDREAEENRLREERLKVRKIFVPTPFVGRSEEKN